MAILWGKLSANNVFPIPVSVPDKCLSSPRHRVGMSFAFYGVQDRACRVVQHPFGGGIHKQSGTWRCAFAVFVLVLSLVVIQGVAAAQAPRVRRILILNEVG